MMVNDPEQPACELPRTPYMRSSQKNPSTHPGERRTRWARVPNGGNLESLPCPLLLRTHDHHGAVGVANHRVGDASHQCSSHTAKAPAAHDYEPGTHLLGQVDDGLIA